MVGGGGWAPFGAAQERGAVHIQTHTHIISLLPLHIELHCILCVCVFIQRGATQTYTF